MRSLLFSLSLCCVVVWGMVVYLVTRPMLDDMPLPTLLPFGTPPPSATPTTTFTSSLTPTATHTPTPTPTATATHTATLATRVLTIHAVMPGVAVTSTPTLFPAGSVILHAPPIPHEPLPDATENAPPYLGWYSFESDHPHVTYSGALWTPRQVMEASRGQYHRTEGAGTATFAFEGEAIQIRYVAAQNMGAFDVFIDGVRVETIDAHAAELSFRNTQPYLLNRGMHVLEVRASGSGVVALDAVHIFRADSRTFILPPQATRLAPTPRPITFMLVDSPPTPQATATPIPLTPLDIAVVIAYDENGNKAVDPAEGVSGVSVRAVEIGTNRVIGQAVTDAGGYATLRLTTAAGVRVVVPYFGKVWEVRRSNAQVARFSLLIAPANQPGLIP